MLHNDAFKQGTKTAVYWAQNDLTVVHFMFFFCFFLSNRGAEATFHGLDGKRRTDWEGKEAESATERKSKSEQSL